MRFLSSERIGVLNLTVISPNSSSFSIIAVQYFSSLVKLNTGILGSSMTFNSLVMIDS